MSKFERLFTSREKLVKTVMYLEEKMEQAEQVIPTKEDKSSLVTSLSAQSTDTQYPSAKCVYDLIGNLETLLASI